MRSEILADLVARLCASDEGLAVQGILEEVFRLPFRPMHRDEPPNRAPMG